MGILLNVLLASFELVPRSVMTEELLSKLQDQLNCRVLLLAERLVGQVLGLEYLELLLVLLSCSCLPLMMDS